MIGPAGFHMKIEDESDATLLKDKRGDLFSPEQHQWPPLWYHRTIHPSHASHLWRRARGAKGRPEGLCGSEM